MMSRPSGQPPSVAPPTPPPALSNTQTPNSDRPGGSLRSPNCLRVSDRATQAPLQTQLAQPRPPQAHLSLLHATCAKCTAFFPRHEHVRPRCQRQCRLQPKGPGRHQGPDCSGPPLPPRRLLQAASTALGASSPPASPAAQGPAPSPARPRASPEAGLCAPSAPSPGPNCATDPALPTCRPGVAGVPSVLALLASSNSGTGARARASGPAPRTSARITSSAHRILGIVVFKRATRARLGRPVPLLGVLLTQL